MQKHFLKFGQCDLLEVTQEINGNQVCLKRIVTLTANKTN